MEKISHPRLLATSAEDFARRILEEVAKHTTSDTDQKLIDLYFTNGHHKNKAPENLLKLEDSNLIEIYISHDAPVGQKTVSFYNEVNPYRKGWSGRVVVVFDKDYPYHNRKAENVLRNLIEGFNTGSGGSTSIKSEMGGYVLAYTTNLYVEDFPLIAKDILPVKLAKQVGIL